MSDIRRQHIALKSELTKAINSGDKFRVKAACTHAVRVWETWGYWSDQWSNWQRALYDAFPGSGPFYLEDL